MTVRHESFSVDEACLTCDHVVAAQICSMRLDAFFLKLLLMGKVAFHLAVPPATL